MIKVRIELWPNGYPTYGKILAEINIGNDSQLADVSDYSYVLDDLGPIKTQTGKYKRSKGKIKGFPRKDLSATDLVHLVLEDAIKKRKPKKSSPKRLTQG